MNNSRFKELKPRTTEIVVSPRAPDFNAVGSKVHSFAEQHNVPRLVHPKGSTETTPASVIEPAAAAKAETHEPVRNGGPAPTRRLTVDVPDYVFNAFHTAGFHVATADLIEDGRRGK